MHLAPFLLFLTWCTGASSYSFFAADKFGNQLMANGAQPSSLVFQSLWQAPLAAGHNITFSSKEYAFFKVPPGQWAAQVITILGYPEPVCWANFTAGTIWSMTWTLNQLDGRCNLSYKSGWKIVFPPDFAQVNPPGGWYTINIAITGLAVDSSQYLYLGYAVMYVTADPRNSDNSSTYLVGGGQPSFLNMGMTTTWNVSAGIIVQVTSSDSAFRSPGANTLAPAIPGTGCSLLLTTAATKSTSQLQFVLTGAACLLPANVPVQFQLPKSLLAVHAVSTTVSITVNMAETDGTTYAASNGNPASYTTTDGCAAWSAWSPCSATCGGGSTYHTRGDSTTACTTTIESRACNTVSCGCAPWAEWGSCSATCGGTISRARLGSVNCNVPTTDTQSCGPRDCNCPWSQTNCSSSCGSGVRSRTITPVGGAHCGAPLTYDLVCNETFTTESLSCPCVDVPWTDRFGSTCADYVANQWCTSSGDYGPGWDFSQPGFHSFDYRTNDGNNALSACCGCGKNRCVKDVVLLIDQSASIALSDWQKTQQYLWDRVNLTKFTDQYGNRIGVVQFDVASSVLCPLTWNQTFLLQCINGIIFPAGGGTATSAGLDLAYTVFDRYSSRNRTRMIELLTDGSPNIPSPDSAAEQAAYDSAYALKDAGVTILTMGMGLDCFSPQSPDCLNQDVLNNIASEPASSYAVSLASYSALKAMSLFISSQCQAKFAGFDPSPSPLPQFSPDPSTSPSPIATPFPSPLPSPLPDATELCAAQQSLMPTDWLNQAFPGCNRDGIADLLRQYDCVELGPACNVFQCSLHVPTDVIQQFQSSCGTTTA